MTDYCKNDPNSLACYNYSLCHVTLQCFLPKGAVCYLTPWIWAALEIYFGQMNVIDVLLCQTCMFLSYHHHEKVMASLLVEGDRSHGKMPSCPIQGHFRQNYKQLNLKHLRRPIIDPQNHLLNLQLTTDSWAAQLVQNYPVVSLTSKCNCYFKLVGFGVSATFFEGGFYQ